MNNSKYNTVLYFNGTPKDIFEVRHKDLSLGAVPIIWIFEFWGKYQL